ncbi:hypothetical protein WMW72_33475 [Paenibacillus filicis]|uniref:Uncharacterized protein n=1 Tax=Paenibacillus filicis TaxID=669464 RepID=A0ABU9DVB4_9BACL
MTQELWLQLAELYAPTMYLDEHEPFKPIRVGISYLEEKGPSPSFARQLNFEPEQVKGVLEYAVYWDYDIQHLYDLEHVWVNIGHQGEVVRCEASFHGKYFLGLLPDRSNLEQETHVKLLVQAGKHAFSPIPELFQLHPDVPAFTDERAGVGGVLVPDMFTGSFAADERLNELAEQHLRTFRFQAANRYWKYEWPDGIFVTWQQLKHEIPVRMNELLRRISDESND